MMIWNRKYTQFTAADAERITGLDMARQRDLRRHGYLPRVEQGRAKFDVHLLCGMLAAQKLSDAGIPPSRGWQLAKSCGTLIAARILNQRRGVLDPQGLLNEDLVKVGPGSDVSGVRWCVTEDGRSWVWAKSSDELVQSLGAASVVLDLEQLADRVVKRARAPLVEIVAGE